MSRGQRQVLILLAAASLVILLSAVRPWLTAVEALPSPLPPRDVRLGSGDLAPGVRAVGLLGLAGLLAVVAARGLLRTAVGALLALGGLLVLMQGAQVLLDPLTAAAGADTYSDVSRAEGPVLAVVGGLLLVLAGLLVAVRGRGWSALGRRYESPVAARGPAPDATSPTAGERDLWEALDRGEDPTASQDPESSRPQPRD